MHKIKSGHLRMRSKMWTDKVDRSALVLSHSSSGFANILKCYMYMYGWNANQKTGSFIVNGVA